MNFDVEKSEFLCPLCESICNDALPLLPSTTLPVVVGSVARDLPLLSVPHWLQALTTIVENKVELNIT